MSRDDLTFRDRAAFLDGAATLVVADAHVGRDEASSVEFPLGERSDLEDRLSALLRHFSPDEVVFAGDVLHSFSGLSADARASLRGLVGAVREADARPVLVAGNHDALLREAWDGPVRDEHRVGDAVVCHGHEEPDAEAALYVVGHDHPAIAIEGRKRPCYLYGEGTYRGADVLMLPAFNRLAAGATVNGMRTADFGSPLVTDADALRPVVYDRESHETLWFPPLGTFRRLL
ncbi:metallophosphoesterase [Halegenticoccus tardaugens]|uniref:metallophosphoesterase n=1 Tax=Halegenticoccus tardaugens TaxID=2071624 RepID=UPI001E473BD9|nr:metallophosphoesterase [Halegenticoccus tardaugens]